MRVWLIQIGEPLPIDGVAPRLLRTGIMAQQLADRGHDVTWWCSTFNHWTKTHRYPRDETVEITASYRLRLLHSPGYGRNVSLSRVLDHLILARNFGRAIQKGAPPDLILSCLPTVEMSEIATRFGNEKGIPVIIDVRDLWPDAFLNFIPATLRPLGRLMLSGMYRQARRALRQCSAIVGVSETYLQWGLHLAGREKRVNDKVFPLGYERTTPSPAELQLAGVRLREAGVDPRRVICWFIGTFGRTYDVKPVIDAARMLYEKQDTRALFVLSGDGGTVDECRALAAGLPNVVFTGWLNATEIESMMNVADIGLAAYVENAPQGLPNKIFEYLAGGLVILSSLGAEAAELLSKNECGFTYRAGDAESLNKVLTRLLDDPTLRTRMRAAARKTFDEQFSAERVYGPYIEFIERLAPTGKSLRGSTRPLR